MIVLRITEVLSGDPSGTRKNSVTLLFVAGELINGERIVLNSSTINLLFHTVNCCKELAMSVRELFCTIERDSPRSRRAMIDGRGQQNVARAQSDVQLTLLAT